MIDLGFAQITPQTIFIILIVLVVLTVFATFILPTLPNPKKFNLKFSRTKSLVGALVVLVVVAGVLVVSTGFIGDVREFTGIGKDEDVISDAQRAQNVGEIIYGKVLEVNKENGTIKVESTISKKVFIINSRDSTRYTQDGEEKDISGVVVGELITITTNQLPQNGNKVEANEVKLAPSIMAPEAGE